MDGKVRKPIPGKVARGEKKKTVYFLHDRTRRSNNNYQSQKKNARMTRVTGSRGV
jgi:hypothetical protein